MKAVSLFSGCGGFDLGAQNSGVEIIWANDNYRPAADAYKSLFPNADFVFGDIRDIHEFPQADVLIGCYPCTGFSLGARRRWKNMEERELKNNPNNFLYKEFLRALKQIQPKYLFVENVNGMKTAEEGWFLEEQRKGFEQLGYTVSISSPLLNAAEYGVPQTRKRLFIVGIKNDIPFDYQFPKPKFGKKANLPYLGMDTVLINMPEWPEEEFYNGPFHGHYLTRNRKRNWNEPSYTIVANAHHVPLHPMGEPMRYVEKDTWELQGDINRRLSWRECALLQGLPKHIKPSGSLMDKYRVVGNAVPPKLAEELVKPIIDYEQSLIRIAK